MFRFDRVSAPLFLASFLPVLSGLVTTTAHASTNADARLALHVSPVAAKNPCTTPAATPLCSGVVTEGALAPAAYYVYLLVMNGDTVRGVGGLQCGLQFDGAQGSGVDIFSWSRCSTFGVETGGWPASGGGAILTWDNASQCQRHEPGGPTTGVIAPAGYFYLSAYSDDSLTLTPWPEDGVAKVSDCLGMEYVLEGGGVHHTPSYLGSVAFSASGSTSGHNPCTPLPVPPCEAVGPEVVVEGTVGLAYRVVNPAPYSSVDWSISGNGVITSGTRGSSIIVDAGDPGGFELTATSHGLGGGETQCTKSVTVNPLNCAISGQISVPANSGPYNYRTVTGLAGSSIVWRATGAGHIVGPSDSDSVQVVSQDVGQYLLEVTVTRSGVVHSCSLAVRVLPSGVFELSNAKLLIHLTEVAGSGVCGARGRPVCVEAQTAGALWPSEYFAYLLVADAPAVGGITGLACGIRYDQARHSGVDIFSWDLCATSQLERGGVNGPWPSSGSSNNITWDSTTRCQRSEPGGPGTGVVAAAGYFYLAAYTPDRLEIVPRPTNSMATVFDCNIVAAEVIGPGSPTGAPSHLGYVNFTAAGNVPGYNPCAPPIAVQPTTWSAIKGLYAKPLSWAHRDTP